MITDRSLHIFFLKFLLNLKIFYFMDMKFIYIIFNPKDLSNFIIIKFIFNFLLICLRLLHEI